MARDSAPSDWLSPSTVPCSCGPTAREISALSVGWMKPLPSEKIVVASATPSMVVVYGI